MVVARNSDHFYVLARNFFRAKHVKEGVFAKYRKAGNDYVYQLIKSGSKRIFRMWYTDLITYDEETGKWTVERYPSITTVTWFNNVAYELKLPVWISINNFFIKVEFRNLLGSVSEFIYRLPSEIKWFSFKDNKDLARMVSDLSLRPHRARSRSYRKWMQSPISRGYEVKFPNSQFRTVKLRKVMDYEVGEVDYIKVLHFGYKSKYTSSLAWLESFWITKYLQEKPLSPKLKHLIALLYQIKEIEPNKFSIDLRKHQIYIEINNIANLTVYKKDRNYWGIIELTKVWSGFVLTERGLMRILMQLCEKFK